jgi:hypothetical protein
LNVFSLAIAICLSIYIDPSVRIEQTPHPRPTNRSRAGVSSIWRSRE